MAWLPRSLVQDLDAENQKAAVKTLADDVRRQRREASIVPAAVADPEPQQAQAAAPSFDLGAHVKQLASTWSDQPEAQAQTSSNPIQDTMSRLTSIWDDNRAQQQTPTLSGTPASMPSISAPFDDRPRLIPATITTGPRPGQTLQPGESVGSVTLGSAPEQQKAAYEEALASGLDEEGARILVAVTETEGGLTGNIGDQGQSRGGYQFHEGGQMPGFRAWLAQQGIQGDPNVLVNDIRLTTRYAATGYLGRAIAAGRAQGLSGAELATYVQQHGQVSVDPWKTGQNYQRLYGGAQGPAQQIAPTVPQQQPAAPMPSSTPAQPHTGAKLRVVDEWGNEYEMTQDDLNRRPPGGGKLTVLGPVALNAGTAGLPPAAAPAAPPQAAGGSSSASSLHPNLAQAFKAANGRDPSPEEAAELRQAFGMMA